MTVQEAEALTTFVNQSGEAYRARVMEIRESGESWVVLTHCQGGADPPPIVDLRAYLALPRPERPLAPECRAVLERWRRGWETEEAVSEYGDEPTGLRITRRPCTTAPDGERTLLAVSGALDVYTACVLRDGIARVLNDLPSHTPYVLLDLTELEFLDSVGLGILISLQKRLKEQKGSLRLFGLRAQVAHLFSVTGMHKVLPVFSSEQDAVTGGPAWDPAYRL